MRKLFFVLALLTGIFAYGQNERVTNTDILSFEGQFTTTQRDLLDVPVGAIWLIYNSTAGQFQFSDETDTWVALGGGAADNLGADVTRGLFTVSGTGTLATLNADQVGSANVINNSLTADDLATNSVGTDEIANGAVTGPDIATNAVNAGNIQDGTIRPEDINITNGAGVIGQILAKNSTGTFEWVNNTAGGASQLSELSDVSTATQGASNVLISNGISFGSRQLVEADISNLVHTANTDNQNAGQVSIADAGSYYSGTTVEAALQEIGSGGGAGSDDQNLTGATLNGSNILQIDIEAGLSTTVDLSSLADTGTDDQTALEVTYDNTTSGLTATDVKNALDEVAANNDNQTLTLLNDVLYIERGNNQNLAPYRQTVDTLQLTGTNLEISLSEDNEVLNVVDLASLQDGTGTDDQTAAEVSVAATPTNYTAGTADVEAHLAGIDTALGAAVGTDDQTAIEVPTTTTNFNNILSGTETEVQAALDVIDNINYFAEIKSTGEADIVPTTAADLLRIEGTGGVDITLNGATNTVTIDGSAVTGESTTVSDTPEIDLTLTGSDITAAIVLGSIDETKLDVSTNASLDLADSALQAEVDGSTTNELQDLTLATNTLSITQDPTPGAEIDLSPYLDNTDGQTLSFTDPNLSITGGNSVDLTALKDGTGTDDQTAAEVSFNNVASGLLATDVQAAIDEVEARVDVNDAKVTNTDDQDLTLTGNTLAIEDDPNTDVDLSGYLDNTDSQTLSFTSPNLSITGGNSVDISAIDTNTQLSDEAVQDIVGAMVTTTNNEELITVTYEDLTNDMDFVVNDDLSLYDNTTSNFSTGAHTTDTNLTQEEVEDFAGGMVSAVGDGLVYNDTGGTLAVVDSEITITESQISDLNHTTNTDNQTLSFTSPNLSITGGNSVDLSALQDGGALIQGTPTADNLTFWASATTIKDITGLRYASNNLNNDNGAIIADGFFRSSTAPHFVGLGTSSGIANQSYGYFATSANLTVAEWGDTESTDEHIYLANMDGATRGNSIRLLETNGNAGLEFYNGTAWNEVYHAGNFTATGDGLGPDGDKGDITVGGTGTTLTIDDNTITSGNIITGGVTHVEILDGSVRETDLNISNTAALGQVLTSDGSIGFTWANQSAGVTDHGALTGLGDDDHSTVYARKDARTDGYVWVRRNSTNDAFYITNQSTGGIASFRNGAGDGTEVASVNNNGSISTSATIFASGDIISAGSSNAFQARGSSTGAANISYSSFYESNGTVRKGYVGDAASGNSDIYLASDAGGIIFNESGTYFDLGGASANRWDNVPVVSATGAMEIGSYIDFHESDAHTGDYRYRVQAVSDTELRTLSAGTSAILSAYQSSVEIGRVGANTSGGYLQATDDAGGTVTTIRGYADSDFKYGIDVEVATASTTKDTGAIVIEAGGLGVEGEIHAGGDVEAFNTSDPRLKQNIKPIKNALKKVSKLGGYKYKWKPFVEFMNGNKGTDYGVLTTEVKKVMPEAVRESTHGYDQVQYIKLIPLMIQAMNEQQEIIVDQGRRLDELERKMSKLEKALK